MLGFLPLIAILTLSLTTSSLPPLTPGIRKSATKPSGGCLVHALCIFDTFFSASRLPDTDRRLPNPCLSPFESNEFESPPRSIREVIDRSLSSISPILTHPHRLETYRAMPWRTQKRKPNTQSSLNEADTRDSAAGFALRGVNHGIKTVSEKRGSTLNPLVTDLFGVERRAGEVGDRIPGRRLDLGVTAYCTSLSATDRPVSIRIHYLKASNSLCGRGAVAEGDRRLRSSPAS